MSVANVLLEITGSGDGARRELQETAAELTAFDSIDAEAELGLDRDRFKEELDAAKAELKALSVEKASPDVDLLTAGFEVHIAEIEAQLAILDNKSVDIDVDVRRGADDALLALGREAESAASSLGGGGGGGGGLSGALSSLPGPLGSLAGMGPVAAAVLAVLVTVVTALVGALVAMTASLAAATGGLAALAVGFGALLLPALGLGIGALLRFKSQSDQAGTAANALSETFGKIGDAATKAFGPGLDAVLSGAARGLRGLPQVIRTLGPAFTQFGQAAGDALKNLLGQFSNPAWTRFFQQLLGAAKQTIGPMTSAFSSFATILRNIASASLPFVVSGLKDIAKGMKGIAEGTGTQKFRDDIGGLVGQLQTWLGLMRQLGRVIGGVFKAGDGPGQQFVQTLSDGVKGMADFLNSAEGQDALKRFFSDVLPLAQQLIEMFAQIGLVLLQFGQAFAPVLTPAVAAINSILGVVNSLLGALNGLPAGIRNFVLFGPLLASASSALGLLAGAIDALRGAFPAIGSAAASAFNAVKNAATTAWNAVRSAFSRAISFVVHLPGGLAGAAAGIWGAVKGVISRAIQFVLSLPGNMAGLASGIWGSVRGIISRAIQFVLHLPDVSGLASAAWNAAKSILEAPISLHISVPHISVPDPTSLIPGHAAGVRNFLGGASIVGEEGPELVNLPAGSDVFSAPDTRRILENMAAGIRSSLRPNLSLSPAVASGPSLDGAVTGGAAQINHINIETVGQGGDPDAELLVAEIDGVLRARGMDL